MGKNLKKAVFGPFWRFIFLPALFVVLLVACSSYQPTKDVWKGTKSFWNSHVSPTAQIDYTEKGDLTKYGAELANGMMELDQQLSRLERTMMNADKPPTKAWVSTFMTNFPWLNGFAGVKYDGSMLGRTPEPPLKQLDFIPLLYEDKKQSSRALRADVQNTPLGPEVILAVPLFDNTEFLGVIATHFDMRTLGQFAGTSANIVILAPQALLWPGKYDYAATPLANVDWWDAVSKSSSGTCKNANGSFYYVVRYFANLPLIFAVPDSGTFAEGDSDPASAARFFPAKPEQLPPPPRPERKSRKDLDSGQQLTPPTAANVEGTAQPASSSKTHDIQPGSSDSVLLKGQTQQKTRVQERRLEGDDVPVKRVQRQKVERKRPEVEKIDMPGTPDTGSERDGVTLPGGRPSPFGPRGENSPDGIRERSASGATDDSAGNTETTPPVLSGGRPSPFGPKE